MYICQCLVDFYAFLQAKTYYLCGVVLRTVHNLIKRQIGQKRSVQKSKMEKKLAALSHFTVDHKAAAKQGLPTRHVTMKTGGGLTYASQLYYEVFSKMEDRFFCTVSAWWVHAW